MSCLLHYGTTEQKNHYLPRLADGREIPCFGLTGPTAGSDATSIPDFGIVCEGDWNGARVVGVRMNFDKRYITLAPVATIIGMAFRLYDPDCLLSDKRDRGITLALVPRNTAGVDVGRRHFPLNCVFQNGPVHGKDVFLPLVPTDRRRRLRRPWLAHAGRVPVDRPLDHAALDLERRVETRGRGDRRLLRASASSSGSRSAASKASKRRWRGSPAIPMR